LNIDKNLVKFENIPSRELMKIATKIAKRDRAIEFEEHLFLVLLEIIVNFL
jgi:hypothetical protein